MQKTKEMRVSPGPGDPQMEGVATQSEVFLLGNPVDKGTWRAIAHGVIKADMTEATEHAYSFKSSFAFMISLLFGFCVSSS